MDQTTPKLGTILDKNVNQKDAVHIAVAPVTTNQRLEPGVHVSLVAPDVIGVVEGTPTIGIVDPLLKRPVEKGERCYLWMYPGTITSLRHTWTHPAFQAMIEVQRKEMVGITRRL